MPYADPGDPQTLNLYVYGRNNPVTVVDADGHTPLDWIWEQTGHMEQEVGFGFHLWDGAVEGGPRALHAWHGVKTFLCLCSGPRVPAQATPSDEQGNSLPPQIPLPPGKNGKPNEWVRVPGKGNREKWAPKYPIPSEKGGQPSASWDPEGHWDYKPGDGGPVQHYDPNGQPFTPGEEHGRGFLRSHSGAIAVGAGVVVVGGAIIILSGGSAAPVVLAGAAAF